LTKILRETLEDLKVLKDGVELIDSNKNLHFEIYRIWSQLEATEAL